MAKSVAIELPVAWGDMDAFGHVNNVVYLRWFESGRIAFFEAVEVPHRDVGNACAPILARATCNFLRPLAYPDTVVANEGWQTPGVTWGYWDDLDGAPLGADDFVRLDHLVVSDAWIAPPF